MNDCCRHFSSGCAGWPGALAAVRWLFLAAAVLSAAGCSRNIPESGRTTASAASGEPASRDSSDPCDERIIAEIIRVNSQTIDRMGELAALLEESSDIIMRYSHYTDRHTTRVQLCPECFSRQRRDDPGPETNPPEDIPLTLEQLSRDAFELRDSAARFATHLRLQQDALRHHLKRLREQADAPSGS